MPAPDDILRTCPVYINQFEAYRVEFNQAIDIFSTRKDERRGQVVAEETKPG